MKLEEIRKRLVAEVTSAGLTFMEATEATRGLD